MWPQRVTLILADGETLATQMAHAKCEETGRSLEIGTGCVVGNSGGGVGDGCRMSDGLMGIDGGLSRVSICALGRSSNGRSAGKPMSISPNSKTAPKAKNT